MSTENSNINPIVDKVLKLQIHRVPIISLSEILGMTVAEVDKVMRENGYSLENGLYKIPTPVEPKQVEKPKKAPKRKKLTAKQKLDAEIEANPQRRLERKYGVYNFETKVFHINVELMKILVMQDEEKLPIDQIASKMNMTVKVLTNYMKKHNYVLQDEPIVKKTRKKQEPRKIFVKVKPEEDDTKIDPNDAIEYIDVPLLVIDETNEVVESEVGLSDEDIINMKQFYNWFLSVKDLQLFNTK